MGAVANFLLGNSSTFETSIGGWKSATDTLSFTRAKYRPESNSSSLRIYNPSGTGASAYIDVTEDESQYSGNPIRAFAWVNPDVSGNVTLYLTSVSGAASATATSTANVLANQWTLVSVELESIPSNISLLRFSVSANAIPVASSIYISRPGIISNWAASRSFAGGEVWLRLPDYLQVADQNQTDPDVPLFRFIEAIFSTADDVDRTWQDFRWIPPEDNDRVIKESGLVSPNTALAPALAWLAQVNGTRLIDPTAAFTPWIYLDNDQDPNTPISWAAWVDALDVNNDTILLWDEIQNYNPQIFNLTESFSVQVAGGFYGFRAGTTESFIAAAQTIDGVNTVTVVPNYTGDPFHIGIQILSSEGGSTVDVADALVNTTPAGYQVTVVAV